MLRKKNKDKKAPLLRQRIPERLRKGKLKSQSIASIIPNIMTTLAMCAGMTAIRMAMLQRFEAALIAVFLAAIFDGMDGRLARLLNSTSKMGAELDSLSDLMCFGVAPGMVIYIKALQHWGEAGWGVVLFYVACVAFRLARFNVISQDETPAWAKGFFVGVPSTAGGLLVLWPITLEKAFGFYVSPFVYAALLVFVGFLMVSRLRIFSMKNVHIPQRYVLPIMLLVVLTISALYSYPWICMSLLGVVYIALIPMSIRSYKKAYVHYSPELNLSNS